MPFFRVQDRYLFLDAMRFFELQTNYYGKLFPGSQNLVFKPIIRVSYSAGR